MEPILGATDVHSNDLKLVKVMDPRVDLSSERLGIVLKGARLNSWQEFFSQNVNNSNVTITANPPSPDVIISRYMLKHFNLTTTISGYTNTSGGPPLNDGYWGPRAYPLAAITTSESITFNDATATQANLATYWNALLWFYANNKPMGGNDSVGPFMLDQFQAYSQGAGTIRNPLALYGDNSFTETRRAYVGIGVSGNTGGATGPVTITWDFVEPVLVSPAVFHKEANFTSGISRIENMTYLCTFQNLNRVFSYIPDQGSGGTIGITAGNINTVLNTASLLMNYYTPEITEYIPRVLRYNYNSIVLYPTNSGMAVAPGGQITITLNNVQLSSVPRRLYFFARRSDNFMTPDVSDTYFGLNAGTKPFNLTWDNNHYLNTASSYDLYNIAARCNYIGSYTQWIQTVGSIIILEPGIDFGVGEAYAPGSMKTIQITASINFVNNHPTDTITPTLYLVCVYDGEMEINNGKVRLSSGQLTPQEVLDAPKTDAITYHQTEHIYGGNLFTKLKNLAVGAHNILKKGKVLSNVLKQIPHPLAQTTGQIAQNLGYGVTGGLIKGGGVTGGGKRCANGTRKKCVGISRSKLKK
jgi:hypothetical protein